MTAPRVALLRPKRNYEGADYLAKNKNSQGVNLPPTHPLRSRGVGVGVAPKGEDEINEVIKVAAGLSVEDRRDLIARLTLELDAKHDPKSRDVEMWAGALHAALQDALGGALGATVGVMTFKTLVAPSKAWQPMSEFMRRSRIGEAQVVERQAMYNLLAELVVSYARKIAKHTGAPLTAKFLVNCSSNIAGVFDAAFPGYLAAGLAPVVARRFHADK